MADIIAYYESKTTRTNSFHCPSGGSYEVMPLNCNPVCSVHGSTRAVSVEKKP
jgi:hypothetical protein